MLFQQWDFFQSHYLCWIQIHGDDWLSIPCPKVPSDSALLEVPCLKYGASSIYTGKQINLDLSSDFVLGEDIFYGPIMDIIKMCFLEKDVFQK